MRSSRTLLLVAFHFPPLGESSGLQRTLSLANDLAERGWEPVVLTVSKSAYRAIHEGQISDVDPRVRVYRAWTMDSARALSIKGRYPRLIALPDAWWTWLLSGIPVGLWIVFRHRPAVIWSTYPIATCHLLALALARLTGRRWVADFRDSMTEESYPPDRIQRRIYRWIESKVIHHASHVVFTSPGTLAMYSSRYPSREDRFRLIQNGYDETYFRSRNGQIERAIGDRSGPVSILHSGVVYQSERDPTQLFDALRTLKLHGLDGRRLRVILRASGSVAEFSSEAKLRDIDDMVVFGPPVGYRDALREMFAVDGLLIMQGSSCNHQIPAKIYEYFRSGTPILALTDPAGDTANLLRETGCNRIAPLDHSIAIAELLSRFVSDVERGSVRPYISPTVSRFSRTQHAALVEEMIATDQST